jgi:predicted O-methyltransferase YrrM
MASPAAEFAARLAGPWSDIQDHLQFLHDAVLVYPRAQVIELGVRSGNSTSALLSAVQETGGHLWSCDLRGQGEWPHNSPFPPEWLELPEWTFLAGDSVSEQVLAQMPAVADVAFMDTSHTFDQQLAELTAYVPRVRPGGVVLVHDTQCVYDPGSGREFRATAEAEGEVARALDAYCELAGLTWVNRHSEPTWYGLGVLAVPGKDTTPPVRPSRARPARKAAR